MSVEIRKPLYKKGDLVFFHTKEKGANSPTTNNHYPGHVGIYLGDKNFIHVDPTKEKIVIDIEIAVFTRL